MDRVDDSSLAESIHGQVNIVFHFLHQKDFDHGRWRDERLVFRDIAK
jgi:hypothetical protein